MYKCRLTFDLFCRERTKGCEARFRFFTNSPRLPLTRNTCTDVCIWYIYIMSVRVSNRDPSRPDSLIQSLAFRNRFTSNARRRFYISARAKLLSYRPVTTCTDRHPDDIIAETVRQKNLFKTVL